MPKFKIGIFGSAAGGGEMVKATAKAQIIGEALAKTNCVVITGACPGLPFAAAEAAHALGGEVWGFSPSVNLINHKKATPKDNPKIYRKIFYIPKNFRFVKDLEVTRKYRNVLSTATADAGIVISGRWGSMHEFCSLHDYGKVIGVLTGTGGIAKELPQLMRRIAKPSQAKVIFNSNPVKLVKLVIEELKKRKL